MKATLEFDLPVDRHEHLVCIHGSTYWSALWRFRESLRAMNKHGIDVKTPQEAVEKIWQTFLEDTSEVNWDEIA